jgi:endonuclease YncB( thermonuclease family)
LHRTAPDQHDPAGPRIAAITLWNPEQSLSIPKQKQVFARIGTGQRLQSFPDMALTLLTLSAAAFALCPQGPRTTCVVDGDTFWLQGEKVRIADINAPETHGARCAFEQALGDAATRRLIALLNAGPFNLAPHARNRDRYGRLLRVVVRHGHSLGAQLVNEGLAEPWRGRRSGWCAGAS